ILEHAIPPEHAAIGAACDVLAAAGIFEYYIATGPDVRWLGGELQELRRLRSFADELARSRQAGGSDGALLTAKEAAAFIGGGLTDRWFFRHAKDLPFTVRVNRRRVKGSLKFSKRGIEK